MRWHRLQEEFPPRIQPYPYVKGDTTTLEDFGVIAKLKESDEA